jgi:hypothetical protein
MEEAGMTKCTTSFFSQHDVGNNSLFFIMQMFLLFRIEEISDFITGSANSYSANITFEVIAYSDAVYLTRGENVGKWNIYCNVCRYLEQLFPHRY